MRWDKIIAGLKKALMTILQPLSDLGWKPMAAGRGARRKEVLWGHRASAFGETFASDIRPWDALIVGWRALTLTQPETVKIPSGGWRALTLTQPGKIPI